MSTTPASENRRSRSPSRTPRRTPSRGFDGWGERRRARERALELCYEAEVKGITGAELLVDLPVKPEDFTVRIVEGLTARSAEVDRLVTEHSAGWAIDRMPAVDRALLRAATYELLAEPDVPTAVVIDEAIELAKEYSTEDSGRFLNGVLASIAAEVRSTPPS